MVVNTTISNITQFISKGSALLPMKVEPHTINPLITIAVIFGIIILIFTLAILGARFRWWKKIKENLVYQFKRTSALRVYMLQKNKQLDNFVVTYDVTKTFEHKEGKYTINPEFFVYEGGKAIAFYFEGNPNPLKVDFEDKDIKMDTETFKGVMNQKLIRDLFAEGKEQLLIVIVIILIIVNMLLQIAIKMGLFDKVIKQ